MTRRKQGASADAQRSASRKRPLFLDVRAKCVLRPRNVLFFWPGQLKKYQQLHFVIQLILLWELGIKSYHNYQHKKDFYEICFTLLTRKRAKTSFLQKLYMKRYVGSMTRIGRKLLYRRISMIRQSIATKRSRPYTSFIDSSRDCTWTIP